MSEHIFEVQKETQWFNDFICIHCKLFFRQYILYEQTYSYVYPNEKIFYYKPDIPNCNEVIMRQILN